jgi:NAD(P)-dependent dehydrogenase (short-subunit alcohol dehydrogenase family)
MRGLKGRVTAVTGGASGIGKATVKRLVEEGSIVAILDKNATGAKAYAAELTGQGYSAIGIGVDVAVESEVEAAFRMVGERYGSLGALVACAGIFLPDQDSRVDTLEQRVWNHIIDVNLTGMFLTCKHAIPALRSSGRGGSIICVGSPTGLYGLAPQTSAYSSSKGGIAGMARAMAVGHAPEKIRVNVVLPGVVLTAIADPEQLKPFLKMLPMQRAAEPDEIASVIAFLASDDSSFMTGSLVYCDGGVTAGSPILD